MSSCRITTWKMMKLCFDSIIRSLFSTGMSAVEIIYISAHLILFQGLSSRPGGAKNGMSASGPPNHANWLRLYREFRSRSAFDQNCCKALRSTSFVSTKNYVLNALRLC